MSIVGRVTEIWRYPVKSMQGESLASSPVDALGILGDRGWAVRDEKTAEIRGAKKFPDLMACSASYVSEPAGDDIPVASIVFPDQKIVRADSAEINSALSSYLGTAVTLHPRRPATDLAHYRRTVPLTEEELRDVLGRTPNEQLPDLSIMPEEIINEIIEYTSPRGTYFDAYPIHLLTTSWLASLADLNMNSRFEVPRFRPNIVIDGADEGFAELAWCDQDLRIGSTVFKCDVPTIRCGMTTQPTADLPKDNQVLRTIVRDSDQSVGAYATITMPGTISVGDAVALL